MAQTPRGGFYEPPCKGHLEVCVPWTSTSLTPPPICGHQTMGYHNMAYFIHPPPVLLSPSKVAHPSSWHQLWPPSQSSTRWGSLWFRAQDLFSTLLPWRTSTTNRRAMMSGSQSLSLAPHGPAFCFSVSPYCIVLQHFVYGWKLLDCSTLFGHHHW